VAELEQYVTSVEAAKVLGKSRNQVLKYVRDGLLPGVRVGQNVLINIKDLEQFVPPPRGNPMFRKR